MIITITYFLFLCLAFIAISIIGWLVNSLLKLDNSVGFHHLVFRNSLTGMVAAVSIYAIIICFGKTILTGLIVLFLFYLIFQKRDNSRKVSLSISGKFSFKEILFIAIPLIIFFGWKITYVFGLNFSYPNVINADDLCHVQRAMFFNNFGVETSDLNYLQVPNGVQPFHYFESWQIAFFQRITQGNFWLCEQLIVIPLTCSMIFYGVAAILKKFEVNKFALFLSIIAAFGGAFYLSQFVEIPFLKWTEAFNSTPFTEYWAMKYGILYLIIINFILLYITNHKKWAILSLLSLPIFSITLAPSILLGVFMILIYFKIKKTITLTWLELLLPIIIGVYILTFYALFKSSTIFIEIPGIRSVISEFFVPLNIKRNVILMAEKAIHVFAFYFPYIALFFILKRSSKLNSDHARSMIHAFGILLFISIISLPMWPLFYSTFGSSEFFNYPSIAIFNIIGVVLFLYFIGKSKGALIYTFGSVVALFFIYKTSITNNDFQKESTHHIYSSEYLEEIYSMQHVFSGISGGIINDSEEFLTGHHHNSYGFYVYGFSDEPVYNISLTRHAENLPKELTKQQELFAKTSPFFRHIERLKSTKEFVSILDAQRRYIEENNLTYLIIYPNSTLPKNLDPLIEKIITDKKSGEKFVVLKS
jgi:hypothetical protein